MLSNLGAPELIIIALLLILFFGGRKIPELVRGVGDAIREFKKGAKEDKDKEEE